MDLFLGIDFGTSGARAIAIDYSGTVCAQAQYSFVNSPLASVVNDWQVALFSLLESIPLAVRRQLCSIAIDGTSSTVLLCDEQGLPVLEPLLYNDGRGKALMDELREIVPANHPVISATSSLAKLLWCRRQGITENTYLLHQADWLAFLLHGKLGISDYHNALKLGYDPGQLCYPNWILQIKNKPNLPEIIAPGMPVATITAAISQQYDLPADCMICAGTTDSIAAFLASGAHLPGEAVTSLGSTLVLKLLSPQRIDDARYGIYSHRLGDLWLVGGASNTGGAVLRAFFSDAELIEYSRQIHSDIASNLDYYPLLKAGERFPINDEQLLPKLDPKPDDPVKFLHGLLESMARIEARGYELLQQLGASALTQVYSAGGGAKNTVWGKIRERYLKVPVPVAKNTEAAYGTALLAKQNFSASPNRMNHLGEVE